MTVGDFPAIRPGPVESNFDNCSVSQIGVLSDRNTAAESLACRNRAAGWKLQIENETGAEVKELYYLPDDVSTMSDLFAQYPGKVGELLDAAARIDADVSAGIRPEWVPQSREIAN